MSDACRRRAREGVALFAIAAALLLLAACGGSKKKNNNTAASTTPAALTTAVASATVLPGVPITTPGALPVQQRTPVVTPIPHTPTPQPTPAVRNENGLQIVDVSFDAVVSEAGGVRIRSAPQVDSGNVVGSLPQGAPVQVEGRVLNGAEAEPGLGTVWCIVGVKQYIYCGNGYITQNGASPTPTR
jgi:hypothetical protein